jgi:hypothetical protein
MKYLMLFGIPFTVGLSATLAALVTGLQTQRDPGVALNLPGVTNVVLKQPGLYKIFYEVYRTDPSATPRIPYGLENVKVTVMHADSGTQNGVERVTAMERYTQQRIQGLALWQFTATTPGTYTVTLEYPENMPHLDANLVLRSYARTQAVRVLIKSLVMGLGSGTMLAVILYYAWTRLGNPNKAIPSS